MWPSCTEKLEHSCGFEWWFCPRLTDSPKFQTSQVPTSESAADLPSRLIGQLVVISFISIGCTERDLHDCVPGARTVRQFNLLKNGNHG